MNIRRVNSIRGGLDTYVFILIASILFHIHPPAMAGVTFDVIGISFLLVIYSGYKYGKYWGALTGVLSVLVWLVFTVFAESDVSLMEYIFGIAVNGSRYTNFDYLDSVTIVHMSIQSLLLYGFLGFFAGLIVDKIEAILRNKNIQLIDLLPFSPHNFMLSVGIWFERTAKALFLLQLDPEDKEGVLKRRLRKIFVLVVTIPLISLFLFLSLNLSYNFDEATTLYLIPALLSPVLALWLSHRISSTVGVWLSTVFLFSPLVFLYAEEVIEGKFSLYNTAAPFSIVLSLGVAAWVIGTISKQLQDDTLRNKLFPSQHELTTFRQISVSNIILLSILTIEFYYKNEGVYFRYFSTLMLSLYILWISFRHSASSVSNMVLIVLGLFSLFSVERSLWIDGLNIRVGRISVPEIVFLSVLPYVAKYVRIHSLNAIRGLIIGLFISLSIVFMVFSYGDVYVLPDIFIRVGYESMVFTLPIAIIMLISFEVIARLAWWKVKRNITSS